MATLTWSSNHRRFTGFTWERTCRRFASSRAFELEQRGLQETVKLESLKPNNPAQRRNLAGSSKCFRLGTARLVLSRTMVRTRSDEKLNVTTRNAAAKVQAKLQPQALSQTKESAKRGRSAPSTSSKFGKRGRGRPPKVTAPPPAQAQIKITQAPKTNNAGRRGPGRPRKTTASSDTIVVTPNTTETTTASENPASSAIASKHKPPGSTKARRGPGRPPKRKRAQGASNHGNRQATKVDTSGENPLPSPNSAPLDHQTASDDHIVDETPAPKRGRGRPPKKGENLLTLTFFIVVSSSC